MALLNARKKLISVTLVGLEPTISGSVDRCLIHWAIGPLVMLHNYSLRCNSIT